MIFDPWPIIQLYPKKAQREQKVIIAFIESWKETDSQTETLCTSPVFLKIRVFQNASNSICTTMRTTGVRLLAQSDVVY